MKPTTTHWLETARAVVENKQFEFVDAGRKRTSAAWRKMEEPEDAPARFVPANMMPKRKRKRATVALDMVTANLLVTVHDALSPENRAKFTALSLLKAVAVAWKCVKR